MGTCKIGWKGSTFQFTFFSSTLDFSAARTKLSLPIVDPSKIIPWSSTLGIPLLSGSATVTDGGLWRHESRFQGKLSIMDGMVPFDDDQPRCVGRGIS